MDELMSARVVIGMSGGVDSSVAAHLLKEEGYDVTGLTLLLYPDNSKCCNLEDVQDAKNVASLLGIKHRVIDATEMFIREIVDPFARDYLKGSTPNPCPRCNEIVRFAMMLKFADELGAEWIATGHYARVADFNGTPALYPAADPEKSQDYFLALLPPEILSRVRFPLGSLLKKRVKEISDDLDLPLKGKRESQDVCFVPDNGYVSFLVDHFKAIPEEGDIVNRSGEILGRHRGLLHYTVGQRKGLNISAPNPLYVLSLDTRSNRLVVGEREEACVSEMEVRPLRWDNSVEEGRFLVRFRYRHTPAAADVKRVDGEILVKYDEPQFAPAPGQLAVFYSPEDKRVVGGGEILTDALFEKEGSDLSY